MIIKSAYTGVRTERVDRLYPYFGRASLGNPFLAQIQSEVCRLGDALFRVRSL
jgi:hypothetical protein